MAKNSSNRTHVGEGGLKIRSVKSPPKAGTVPVTVVARAVRKVANMRAASDHAKSIEPRVSK